MPFYLLMLIVLIMISNIFLEIPNLVVQWSQNAAALYPYNYGHLHVSVQNQKLTILYSVFVNYPTPSSSIEVGPSPSVNAMIISNEQNISRVPAHSLCMKVAEANSL